MNAHFGLLAVLLATSFSAAPLFADDQKGLQEADRNFAEDLQRLLDENKRDQKDEANEARQAREEWEKLRKAGGQSFRRYVKGAQMALGRFGYAAGPFTGSLNEATKQAIKEYQTYNRLEGTGELSLETFEMIMKDVEVLEREPVPLPSRIVSVSNWDTDVFAQGTWIMANDRIGYPYNTAYLTCLRSIGICVTATANIVDTRTGQVHVSQVIAGIDRWDDYEIVTDPTDSRL